MEFFSKKISYLGIDIGTSCVKTVELKKEKKNIKLLTYGFTENKEEMVKGDFFSNIKYTAKLLSELVEKSGAESRNAVAALPAHSVFSSIINLSNVDKKDIASAIHWEAKKLIPLPLDQMALDWKEINYKDKEDKNNKNTKILLTGAPKNLVKKYIDIFKEAKINLLSLETETFSLIRCLIGNDKSTIMLIEVGMSTTDISIVSNGISILNRSIDIGGLAITRSISHNLNIGMKRAEQFKYDLGISSFDSSDNAIPKTIIESINPIINEVKHMISLFESKGNPSIEKIILSGGSSMLPNLTKYFEKIFNINVVIGDPWSRIAYPLDLEPVLKEIGPRLSVAVGLAIREIE
jgi:type IV pilus assembly protein PilM